MKYNLGALIFATLVAFHLSVKNVTSMRARLLGGRNATSNEIKYIVFVKSGNSTCGGGIINDKLIITAAHCVKFNETTGALLKPMRIMAATNTRIKYDRTKTIVIKVARAFLPAVYHQIMVNDIAILELTKSLELEKNKDKLQKLRLPIPSKSDNTYPTYDNVQFKFAGYGTSHVDMVTDEIGMVQYHSSSAGRLKVANATVIDKKTCESAWNVRFSDKIVCIGITEDKTKKTSQGICSGDSGSPAVIGDFVIGVASTSSIRCDDNYKPSVFTRVSSYIDFIKNVMEGNTERAVIYSAQKL